VGMKRWPARTWGSSSSALPGARSARAVAAGRDPPTPHAMAMILRHPDAERMAARCVATRARQSRPHLRTPRAWMTHFRARPVSCGPMRFVAPFLFFLALTPLDAAATEPSTSHVDADLRAL